MDRLEKILNQILIFPQEAHLNLQAHNMNTILEESIGIFQEEFQRDQIHMIKALDPSLPPILCDYSQIKQAFVNIHIYAVYVVPCQPRNGVRCKV